MLRVIVWGFVACVALVGCEHRARVSRVELTGVDVPPPNIEAYPQTSYEGHRVYLYRGHWYFRDGDAWSYYRDEPRELAERRHRMEEPRRARRLDERSDDRLDRR